MNSWHYFKLRGRISGRPDTIQFGGAGLTRIHTLQALRAIAALLVLAFHLFVGTPTGFHPGTVGVDIFFVISGFIITRIVGRPDVRIADFVRSRLARIVPIYWLMTVAALLLWAVFPAAVPGTLADLRNIALSLAFVPHAVPPGFNSPVLLQGWTLNYEMGFYLTATSCLAVAWRYRRLALGAYLLGTALIAMYLNWFNVLVSPLSIEFAIGAGLALAEPWITTVASRWLWWLLWGAGGAILAAEVVFPIPDYGMTTLLHAGVGLLMVLGALLAENRSPARLIRGLGAIGDASYALYLSHLLVIMPLGIAIASWPLGLRLPALAVAAVGIAMLIHRHVEAPLHRKCDAILGQCGAILARIWARG